MNFAFQFRSRAKTKIVVSDVWCSVYYAHKFNMMSASFAIFNGYSLK